MFFSLNKQDGCQCNICIGVFQVRAACSVSAQECSGTLRKGQSHLLLPVRPGELTSGSYRCINHPNVGPSELTFGPTKWGKLCNRRKAQGQED